MPRRKINIYKLCLLIIWISFIIIIGIFLKPTNKEFVFISMFMFFLTYICNVKMPIKLSLKYAILISIPSNIIFWYIFYKCNDFLFIEPYSWESFLSVFLVYSYILMYIVFENIH